MPTGAGGDVDPADLDAVHHLGETAAGGAAEHAVARQPEVAEQGLGGVDALVAHLVDLAGDGQAGQHLAEADGLLHQEGGEVLVRFGGALVGPRQQRDQVGAGPVGQPHLGAVDDVAVAVTDRPGLDRGDVRAEVGLGHGERAADLAGRHPRQERRLLLGGAVLPDHVGHDEVGVDDAGDAHPAARDLLDHERVGQQRLAKTAVVLGNHQAEQAHLAHARDDVGRVLVGVLERLRVRDDLPVHELPDRGQDLLLDVGQSGGLRETGHGNTPCSQDAAMTPRSRSPASSAAVRPSTSAEDLPGFAAEERGLPWLAVAAVPAQRRAGGDRCADRVRRAERGKLDVGQRPGARRGGGRRRRRSSPGTGSRAPGRRRARR